MLPKAQAVYYAHPCRGSRSKRRQGPAESWSSPDASGASRCTYVVARQANDGLPSTYISNSTHTPVFTPSSEPPTKPPTAKVEVRSSYAN